MAKEVDVKIEMLPDSWATFERAVDVVVKAPPAHRVKEKRQQSLSDRAESLLREGEAATARLAARPFLKPLSQD